MKKLFLSLLLFASPLLAQEYPIVELHAAGSELFDEQEITAYAGLKVDRRTPVPVTAVRDAAQKLVRSGVFKTVAYTHTAAPGGMKVEFKVTDKKDDQFLKADFANLVWFTPEEIQAGLKKRIPLFNGYVPIGGGLQDEISAALAAMLETKGVKGHVGNTFLMPDHEGPPESMMFALDDVSILIARIETPGASADFAKPLSEALRKMVQQPYFVARMRNFARNILVPFYRKKGFLKAKFGEPVPGILSNDAGVTRVAVTLPVEEGRAYNFMGARWAGNKALSETDIGRLVHFFPGLPMNAELLQSELEKVRLDYATLGYMKMTLEAGPVFDDEKGEVRYEFLVREGPLFRMGKLDFEGFTEAAAEKVRQQFKLREGEPFDFTYVRDFFSHMPTQTATRFLLEESEGDQPNTVDLTVVLCPTGSACKPTQSTLYSPSEKETQ
ncbi:MAG: hypothetical protein HYX26_08995 [Acidobacteriales bacterium]|nr:hypothetical protein [Terriglobales bacterium]